MKRIESVNNPQVKLWKKLVQQKKARDKEGQYLVEGIHLVEEAIEAKKAEVIIVTEGVEYPHEWEEENEIIEVTRTIGQQLADTETSQLVFALCKKETRPFYDATGKQFLLLDAVQDPGNVGTLIRTADAAGMDAVVIGKGSADPFSPKVLRAAQGSTFHLPIYQLELDEAFHSLDCLQLPNDATVWTKSANREKEGVPKESFALIVGNEGQGVSPYYMERADHIVYIPMPGKAESLNVGIAAGVIMFHYN